MREKLWNWTVDRLIALAKRNPYFHLYHGNGELYMERYWLVPFDNDREGCYHMKWWREPFGWFCQRFNIAMRLHFIHTADHDRALHDHPWNFISVVLRGSYTEALAKNNNYPCFIAEAQDEGELCRYARREEGSIAYRYATDRHRITSLSSGGCVTLFITGPRRQWWGFYTPRGKIYYKDFDSVHNKVNIGRAAPISFQDHADE